MPNIDRTPIPDEVFHQAAAEIVAAEQPTSPATCTADTESGRPCILPYAHIGWHATRPAADGPYDAGDAPPATAPGHVRDAAYDAYLNAESLTASLTESVNAAADAAYTAGRDDSRAAADSLRAELTDARVRIAQLAAEVLELRPALTEALARLDSDAWDQLTARCERAEADRDRLRQLLDSARAVGTAAIADRDRYAAVVTTARAWAAAQEARHTMHPYDAVNIISRAARDVVQALADLDAQPSPGTPDPVPSKHEEQHTQNGPLEPIRSAETSTNTAGEREEQPTALCVLGPNRPAADIRGDIAPARVLAALEILGWPDDREHSAHVEPDGFHLTAPGHYYGTAEDAIRAADEAGDTTPADRVTAASVRRQLDQAITDGLPFAGSRVRGLLKALRRELGRVDADRAARLSRVLPTTPAPAPASEEGPA